MYNHNPYPYYNPYSNPYGLGMSYSRGTPGTAPGSIITTPGRSTGRYSREEYNEYMRELMERMRLDYERRRDPTAAAAAAAIPTGPKPIEVQLVEFYTKENAKDHHTADYEIVDSPTGAVPVLRRGQPFYVAIRFKRTFDSRQDQMRLEFTYGPNPHHIAKGTLVQLQVTDNTAFQRDKNRWDVRTHHKEGQVITLQVQLPATIAIGIWKMNVITNQISNPSVSETFKYKENIYIIFNPWVREDSVYMERDDARQEYVLNDVGKIFVGSYNQPKGRSWIYGQFKDAVLPACMYMLELSGLDYSARANPVRVVRAVSACVNREDDNGVVVGNWSGKYEDGTAPWMWTGSAPIMEKFLKSGGESVKYGQCWVFAGVTTTVCRALGIPTRTVTNFVSAHDTDDSLTVDKFFDKDGDEIEEANNDSIWNFHVWNDVWMSRPDLPAGYGGWQAIDATPQETSEGVYRVGPTSLEAVRKGEIGYAYDGPFVFSEVNADVIHWQLDTATSQGWKKLKTNKFHVGRSMLTRSVGRFDNVGDTDAEEILGQYKDPEGTEDERMAVLNAARNGGLSYLYDMPAPGKEDVSMKLRDIDRIMIGQPFHVVVDVENKSNEKRTVSCVVSASSVYYTGIIARKIKREKADFTLAPRQKEQLAIQVTADDYLDKLVDYALVKIYAIATVQETQQTWAEEDDFSVDKPQLKLEIQDRLQIGKEYILKLTLTNPLQRVLDECSFTIEGPGLATAFKSDFRDILPLETITHTVTIRPQRSGSRNFMVVFNCRQIFDVTASRAVLVA